MNDTFIIPHLFSNDKNKRFHFIYCCASLIWTRLLKLFCVIFFLLDWITSSYFPFFLFLLGGWRFSYLRDQEEPRSRFQWLFLLLYLEEERFMDKLDGHPVVEILVVCSDLSLLCYITLQPTCWSTNIYTTEPILTLPV